MCILTFLSFFFSPTNDKYVDKENTHTKKIWGQRPFVKDIGRLNYME